MEQQVTPKDPGAGTGNGELVGAKMPDDASRGMRDEETIEARIRATHATVPPVGAVMKDGTIYAGVSPDTGKAFYVTATDAPLVLTFGESADYAAKLDACGHQDWRLPSKPELNVLFNNRAAIGGFDESGDRHRGWYWSSWQDDLNAGSQRFSNGARSNYSKEGRSSVRCVR